MFHNLAGSALFLIKFEEAGLMDLTTALMCSHSKQWVSLILWGDERDSERLDYQIYVYAFLANQLKLHVYLLLAYKEECDNDNDKAKTKTGRS